ncbi:neurofibromin isoform X3 [Pseudomyrmex gracilis]|uniref:neurofibromin isoform X3 n=1 Tax=Pseudomyrmex gracilis TaxID=219809 RepID=UPI000994D196|nr:neurofibromin isoform X3 [Pseudomyrmex gracilis]
MGTQKPGEWASLVLTRFEDQLPCRSGPDSPQSRMNEKRSEKCLIEISRYRFSLVISGLTKMLQRVNEATPNSSGQRPFLHAMDQDRQESIIIVLDTLEKCLANTPKDTTKFEEAMNVKLLLREICQFICIPYDSSLQTKMIKDLASKVLFALSVNFFNAVFNRISARLQELSSSGEENPDCSDIELMQHINVDVQKLTRLLNETIQKVRQLKKIAYLVLMNSLEKAIWNWMDTHPQEFADLQKQPNEDVSKACEELFDILDTFVDKKSRAATVWPLQMMLLVLSPRVLNEIVKAESGPPGSPRYSKKKQFIDSVKRNMKMHGSSSSRQLTEAAVITCSKLTKAATYVNTADFNSSVVLTLAQQVTDDLMMLLFNPSKSRGQNYIAQDVDLMIDSLVSCYRINPSNNEVFRFCLNGNYLYQFVVVSSLYKIFTQPRLPWWPEINLMYSYGTELRHMFTDTLNKVMQNYTGNTQTLRMIHTFTFKSKEEMTNSRNLLLMMVRLIHVDPMLMLHNDGTASHEKSSLELISGLVSLVHHSTMSDIAYEAMEALLVLHQPEKIKAWNMEAPLITFWDINSQVILSISLKLIQRGANYTSIFKWFREILICRNAFLSQYKDNANVGSQIAISKEAHIKLEIVCLMYLWSTDLEAVLISMSCFALLCEEAEILCGSDEVAAVTCLLPNYQVYLELAQASTALISAYGESRLHYQEHSDGRASMQKKILFLLRKIEHCVNGVQPAWEETFKSWELISRQLSLNYPKTKTEDAQAESFCRTVSNVKRKAAHQNSEHDVEEQINEWANMTGFLCALGGVCFSRHSPSKIDPGPTSVSTNCNQEAHNCQVTQFVSTLLRLLNCNNEKFGSQIQKYVKETVGHEMSPALYPILFDQIRNIIEKFFDSRGQVIISDLNTQFIEHTIFIMHNILDPKTDQPSEYLGKTSIEAMMLAIVRYVRHLDMMVHSICIKTRLCQLVETMMRRRDDLAFRQELKFRNKLVEYLTDWVMWEPLLSSTSDITYTRDLDQACMEAVGALLRGLPLQPEDSDCPDMMEAKSELFSKYFMLFMNLLNYCKEPTLTKNEDVIPGQSPTLATSKLATLRDTTIQAMSNLLSANIDSGLRHSIHLGYKADLKTRAAFMEVLTKTLKQGTEFDTLAETALADRYEQLVDLITIMTEKGDLPIAMALANVVTNEMDELARVFVTIFDAKNLLTPLLWNFLYREVEVTDCIQTVLRGNTLGSKIMSCCFKMFGANYLQGLLEPFIEPLLDEPSVSFEVDSARIESDESIEQNSENLIKLTQKVFDAIISSADVFPSKLRLICHCLYQILCKRFPQYSGQINLVAVETVIFLRFINPAVVSPQEMGIVNKPVPQHVKRGLMLMSKILQNIANHVEFSKEQHMLPFNDFLTARFEIGRKFFEKISLTCDKIEHNQYPKSFVSDANVLTLHRLLWNHQEKMRDYLTSSRDHKALGRTPVDRLATLLAYLGPPEHKPLYSHSVFPSSYVRMTRWANKDISSSNFEDIMMQLNVQEREDFKNIQSMNIFYQAGTSKRGYPVFYYIGRRFKYGETNSDLLIYHVILTLKPFCRSPYDVVIDCTHMCADNRFRTEFLQKWFYMLPETYYENVHAIYIYNCNNWVREHIKFHNEILAPLKGNRKIVFLDSQEKLNDVIDIEQQKLPGATLSLDEDLNHVFTGVLKQYNNKDLKVTIKIGPTSLQVTYVDKSKVLSQYVLLNDVYYASEIQDVTVVDESQFTVIVSIEVGPLHFAHSDCAETIAQAICYIKKRWVLSQSETVPTHAKIRPKDVPGTLLNMALLNLGSPDPNLRLVAYNLLCALTTTFDLKIQGQLVETSCICIPKNNTMFIVHLSETLAANDPHLTLEFLRECMQGFKESTFELKHLCLQYMTPWLSNLVRFYKSQDEELGGKKQKQIIEILNDLITLTIQEIDMYPSMQAKIWNTIGRLPELIDDVLDIFLQRSTQYGLGSPMAEIMADTAVAVAQASANVQLVTTKLINKVCRMLDKTCMSPTSQLEQHVMWSDIAILARYLLMLSFNNCLDVGKHLPYIFHAVTLLVCSGSSTMRASIHGLMTNSIHSLCTCSSPKFSENTHRILRMSLDEFSLPKSYLLFGIDNVKSATAFYNHSYSACENSVNDKWLDNNERDGTQDKENLNLSNLEIITDALLEIMEACMQDIPKCDWLNIWTLLAKNLAFSFNPALQPRALIVFGCISKSITDQDIRQLLKILVKALESFNDIYLIEAIVMCLTRLQPLLRSNSPIHKFLFWIATSVLELDDMTLYASGLALLEQNLHTLDSLNTFNNESLKDVMLSTRKPLEYHFKQLDHTVGLSFEKEFHFALVGHLLKGYRHESPTTVTRTIRVLTMLLGIIAKKSKRDKFEVTPENIPYLIALVAVSEEVRSRCHIRHSINKSLHDSVSGTDILDTLTSRNTDISGVSTNPRRQKTWDLLDQSAITKAKQQKQQPAQRSLSVPSAKEDKTADDSQQQQKDRNARVSVSNETNVLLDPLVLTEDSTQTLVITMLATLVKYSTNENETRILYEYLAEATVVFPKIFPVVHNLLDAKITSVLSSCHDQAILNAVQTIIQNMISCEDASQNLRELNFQHRLQTSGFRGLWRFAGYYTNSNCTPESSEFFARCLEAMIELSLKMQETAVEDEKRGQSTNSGLKTKPPTVGIAKEYSRTSSEIDSSSVHSDSTRSRRIDSVERGETRSANQTEDKGGGTQI